MPALKSWAHVSQRGFINGRVPGHGVIDVDTSSRIIAVKHRIGVLGLFDFSAAFPSISRTFIIFVMGVAGFPDWAIALAAASWDNAKIVLADGSTAYHMCDGVGQGCPAAAALFVIGIDPLLVALGKFIDAADGETLSAYVDDIAMVLAALERMGVVHAIFAKYKLAAALALNF